MLLRKDLEVHGKGFRNFHIATRECSNLGIRVSFRYFCKSQVICSCRINLKNSFKRQKKKDLKFFPAAISCLNFFQFV